MERLPEEHSGRKGIPLSFLRMAFLKAIPPVLGQRQWVSDVMRNVAVVVRGDASIKQDLVDLVHWMRGSVRKTVGRGVTHLITDHAGNTEHYRVRPRFLT